MASLRNRTAVLLGAGASVDAGLPVAAQLASMIVERANDRAYWVGQFAPPDWVRGLNIVYSSMVGHHGGAGRNPLDAVNVETLISAVRLLQDRRAHEVAPFVANWSASLEEFSAGEVSPAGGRDILAAMSPVSAGGSMQAARNIARAVAEIARHALRPDVSAVFRDVEVWILRHLTDILGAVGDVSYLQPLADLARRQEGGLDIVTLNYDLAVEELAAQNGMAVVRGVGEWRAGSDLSFPAVDGTLNLLKMHGSLDWLLAQTGANLPTLLASPRVEVVRPMREVASPNTFLRDGRQSLPWIVVGDREKLATEGPTLALHHAAQRALARASHLAVIGYSFGDQHINAMIRDWLDADQQRTISVLDLRWPRRHGNERVTDFRSALLAGYGCDRDRQGNPIGFRMVPVEGTAGTMLARVLEVRPGRGRPDPLSVVRSTTEEGGLRFDVTWHGPDLTEVTFVAESAARGPTEYVQLSDSPGPPEPGRAVFARIPEWRSGAQRLFYAETVPEFPFALKLSGTSVLGGQSAEIRVDP